MYYYTYLVKNTITNKVYYGKRTTHIEPKKDLWNRYFTSSKVVARDIQEYGISAFTYEIRRFFKNKEKMNIWEAKVLRRCKVEKNTKFMNQHYTSENFVCKSPPFKGHTHTEDSKEKIRQSVIDTKSKKIYKRSDVSIRNIKLGFNKYWEGKTRPDQSKKVSGGHNGRAKTVLTPKGEYATLKEAGNAYSVRWDTIKRWIDKGKEGFYYG